jgi:Zn-dependent protease with chaperone function
MKRIALVCLVTGAAALVIAGLGLAFSVRSQNALYWSLRVGWTILRWFAVIEVLGQGTLAVALSFWVTAFWIERYYVKLIAVAGLLALCAAALIIKAIFRKLSDSANFDGQLVTKEQAPLLWERVSHMAERLKIAPPDNIFVGIDDNFFVTEHPVEVGEKRFTGRTLFMSLSLLKTLTRSEADSVLAHELAHFSGEDTIYSKRISPLLGKYAHYLEALYQGGISRPIFHFMLMFWNAYHLALNKLRRAREFRADKIGAEMTSPNDMAQALVKVAAYCRYRAKVQSTLFGKNQMVDRMDVFQRIESGFPDFIKVCASGTELAEADTPHPFDSHPPLARRIENIGLECKSVLAAPGAVPSVDNSWYSAIAGAEAIEAAQWKAFEETFHAAHQEMLAWRFKPEGEVEIAHVQKYFPVMQFGKGEKKIATLDYEKLQIAADAPIFFSTIKSCRVKEGQLGGQNLVIDCEAAGEKQSHKINLKQFDGNGAQLIKTFEKYYGRHMTAKNYASELARQAETSATTTKAED